MTMRQQKFRAWFGHHKKMVQSENLFLHYDGEDSFDFAFDKEVLDEEGNAEGTMNFIAMQFTGMKDMNGVEVYEGDIVKRLGKIGKVTWDCEYRALGFHLNSCERLMDVINPYSSWSLEVIGNIYEHQHLLEVAK